MGKTFTQNRYLFTDLRHIRCGDLEWFSEDGTYLPTSNPPGPPSAAYAKSSFVPRGIRLQSNISKRELIPGPYKPFGRIIFDEGVYKSWYLETQPTAICYIQSNDGFEWSEPRRSYIDVPGTASHEFVFFLDPVAPADEMYKCVYPVWPDKSKLPDLWAEYQKTHPRYREPRITPDRIQCMYGAISPDGVDWTPLTKPLLINFGDTDNTVYYDKQLQSYVMYTRKYIQERRWIGRAESKNFRDWGPIESIIWPSLDSPFSHDMYTNGRTAYPDLDTYHFMFPWIYERNTQTGGVYLYSSEDGIVWNQLPGEQVIPLGEPGKWDGGYIDATRDLVPFGNSKVAIRCRARNKPHKYPRWKNSPYTMTDFWSWWPEGRVSSLVADEGEFFTFPCIPQGKELRLNVKVARGGDLRVGLLYPGAPLKEIPGKERDLFYNRQNVIGHTVDDCDPIFGDELSMPVHWNGDTNLGLLNERGITIQFRMRAAELFGFQWV